MLPDSSTLVLFMAAVLALNLTPGPDMLFCFATGVNRGRAAGAVAALGIGAGTLVHTAAAALGLAGLLLASPLAFDIVRYAGAAYLVWLAWKIANAAPPEADGAARGRPMSFLQAALFQWVNPKAWVIAGAAILAYGASLLLAVIFALAAFASLYLWALVGLGAARLLRSPAALRWFNRAMAILLLLSLVPVLRG